MALPWLGGLRTLCLRRLNLVGHPPVVVEEAFSMGLLWLLLELNG